MGGQKWPIMGMALLLSALAYCNQQAYALTGSQQEQSSKASLSSLSLSALLQSAIEQGVSERSLSQAESNAVQDRKARLLHAANSLYDAAPHTLDGNSATTNAKLSVIGVGVDHVFIMVAENDGNGVPLPQPSGCIWTASPFRPGKDLAYRKPVQVDVLNSTHSVAKVSGLSHKGVLHYITRLCPIPILQASGPTGAESILHSVKATVDTITAIPSGPASPVALEVAGIDRSTVSLAWRPASECSMQVVPTHAILKVQSISGALIRTEKYAYRQAAVLTGLPAYGKLSFHLEAYTLFGMHLSNASAMIQRDDIQNVTAHRSTWMVREVLVQPVNQSFVQVSWVFQPGVQYQYKVNNMQEWLETVQQINGVRESSSSAFGPRAYVNIAVAQGETGTLFVRSTSLGNKWQPPIEITVHNPTSELLVSDIRLELSTTRMAVAVSWLPPAVANTDAIMYQVELSRQLQGLSQILSTKNTSNTFAMMPFESDVHVAEQTLRPLANSLLITVTPFLLFKEGSSTRTVAGKMSNFSIIQMPALPSAHQSPRDLKAYSVLHSVYGSCGRIHWDRIPDNTTEFVALSFQSRQPKDSSLPTLLSAVAAVSDLEVTICGLPSGLEFDVCLSSVSYSGPSAECGATALLSTPAAQELSAFMAFSMNSSSADSATVCWSARERKIDEGLSIKLSTVNGSLIASGHCVYRDGKSCFSISSTGMEFSCNQTCCILSQFSKLSVLGETPSDWHVTVTPTLPGFFAVNNSAMARNQSPPRNIDILSATCQLSLATGDTPVLAHVQVPLLDSERFLVQWTAPGSLEQGIIVYDVQVCGDEACHQGVLMHNVVKWVSSIGIEVTPGHQAEYNRSSNTVTCTIFWSKLLEATLPTVWVRVVSFHAGIPSPEVRVSSDIKDVNSSYSYSNTVGPLPRPAALEATNITSMTSVNSSCLFVEWSPDSVLQTLQQEAGQYVAVSLVVSVSGVYSPNSLISQVVEGAALTTTRSVLLCGIHGDGQLLNATIVKQQRVKATGSMASVSSTPRQFMHSSTLSTGNDARLDSFNLTHATISWRHHSQPIPNRWQVECRVNDDGPELPNRLARVISRSYITKAILGQLALARSYLCRVDAMLGSVSGVDTVVSALPRTVVVSVGPPASPPSSASVTYVTPTGMGLQLNNVSNGIQLWSHWGVFVIRSMVFQGLSPCHAFNSSGMTSFRQFVEFHSEQTIYPTMDRLSSSVFIDGLRTSVSYTLFPFVVSLHEDSPFVSCEAFATGTPIGPPSVHATSLKLDSVTETTALVSWLLPSGLDAPHFFKVSLFQNTSSQNQQTVFSSTVEALSENTLRFHDLELGVQYTLKIVGINLNNQSNDVPMSEGAVLNFATELPPLAPMNVIVQDITSNTTTLQWSSPPANSPTVISFVIKAIARDVASVFPEEVTMSPDLLPSLTGSNTFVVTGLVSDRPIEFRVYAKGLHSDGYVNFASVVTTPSSVPSLKAENLRVVFTSNVSVILAWALPAAAQSAPLRHLLLEGCQEDCGTETEFPPVARHGQRFVRADGTQFAWSGFDWEVVGSAYSSVATLSPRQTMAEINSIGSRALSPQYSYNFRISAVGIASETPGPAAFWLAVKAAPPPLSPSNPVASTPNKGSVILNWVASPASDLRAGLSHYVVQSTFDDGQTFSTVSSQFSTASGLVTGLQAGLRYKFRVAASSSSGISEWSSLSNALSTPATPENMQIVELSSSSVRLRWDASPNPQLIKYRIEFRKAGETFDTKLLDVRGNDFTISVTGISSGDQAEIKVTGGPVDGDYDDFPATLIFGMAAAPTASVTSLRALTATNNTLKIAFNGISGLAAGEDVHTEYIVDIMDSEGRTRSNSRIPHANEIQATLVDLQAAEPYLIKVTTANGAGVSQSTSLLNVTIPKVVLPPINASVVSTTAQSVTLRINNHPNNGLLHRFRLVVFALPSLSSHGQNVSLNGLDVLASLDALSTLVTVGGLPTSSQGQAIVVQIASLSLNEDIISDSIQVHSYIAQSCPAPKNLKIVSSTASVNSTNSADLVQKIHVAWLASDVTVACASSATVEVANHSSFARTSLQLTQPVDPSRNQVPIFLSLNSTADTNQSAFPVTPIFVRLRIKSSTPSDEGSVSNFVVVSFDSIGPAILSSQVAIKALSQAGVILSFPLNSPGQGALQGSACLSCGTSLPSCSAVVMLSSQDGANPFVCTTPLQGQPAFCMLSTPSFALLSKQAYGDSCIASLRVVDIANPSLSNAVASLKVERPSNAASRFASKPGLIIDNIFQQGRTMTATLSWQKPVNLSIGTFILNASISNTAKGKALSFVSQVEYDSTSLNTNSFRLNISSIPLFSSAGVTLTARSKIPTPANSLQNSVTDSRLDSVMLHAWPSALPPADVEVEVFSSSQDPFIRLNIEAVQQMPCSHVSFQVFVSQDSRTVDNSSPPETESIVDCNPVLSLNAVTSTSVTWAGMRAAKVSGRPFLVCARMRRFRNDAWSGCKYQKSVLSTAYRSAQMAVDRRGSVEAFTVWKASRETAQADGSVGSHWIHVQIRPTIGDLAPFLNVSVIPSGATFDMPPLQSSLLFSAVNINTNAVSFAHDISTQLKAVSQGSWMVLVAPCFHEDSGINCLSCLDHPMQCGTDTVDVPHIQSAVDGAYPPDISVEQVSVTAVKVSWYCDSMLTPIPNQVSLRCPDISQEIASSSTYSVHPCSLVLSLDPRISDMLQKQQENMFSGNASSQHSSLTANSSLEFQHSLQCHVLFGQITHSKKLAAWEFPVSLRPIPVLSMAPSVKSFWCNQPSPSSSAHAMFECSVSLEFSNNISDASQFPGAGEMVLLSAAVPHPRSSVSDPRPENGCQAQNITRCPGAVTAPVRGLNANFHGLPQDSAVCFSFSLVFRPNRSKSDSDSNGVSSGWSSFQCSPEFTVPSVPSAPAVLITTFSNSSSNSSMCLHVAASVPKSMQSLSNSLRIGFATKWHGSNPEFWASGSVTINDASRSNLSAVWSNATLSDADVRSALQLADPNSVWMPVSGCFAPKTGSMGLVSHVQVCYKAFCSSASSFYVPLQHLAEHSPRLSILWEGATNEGVQISLRATSPHTSNGVIGASSHKLLQLVELQCCPTQSSVRQPTSACRPCECLQSSACGGTRGHITLVAVGQSSPYTLSIATPSTGISIIALAYSPLSLSSSGASAELHGVASLGSQFAISKPLVSVEQDSARLSWNITGMDTTLPIWASGVVSVRVGLSFDAGSTFQDNYRTFNLSDGQQIEESVKFHLHLTGLQSYQSQQLSAKVSLVANHNSKVLSSSACTWIQHEADFLLPLETIKVSSCNEDGLGLEVFNWRPSTASELQFKFAHGGNMQAEWMPISSISLSSPSSSVFVSWNTVNQSQWLPSPYMDAAVLMIRLISDSSSQLESKPAQIALKDCTLPRDMKIAVFQPSFSAFGMTTARVMFPTLPAGFKVCLAGSPDGLQERVASRSIKVDIQIHSWQSSQNRTVTVPEFAVSGTNSVDVFGLEPSANYHLQISVSHISLQSPLNSSNELQPVSSTLTLRSFQHVGVGQIPVKLQASAWNPAQRKGAVNVTWTGCTGCRYLVLQQDGLELTGATIIDSASRVVFINAISGFSQIKIHSQNGLLSSGDDGAGFCSEAPRPSIPPSNSCWSSPAVIDLFSVHVWKNPALHAALSAPVSHSTSIRNMKLSGSGKLQVTSARSRIIARLTIIDDFSGSLIPFSILGHGSDQTSIHFVKIGEIMDGLEAAFMVMHQQGRNLILRLQATFDDGQEFSLETVVATPLGDADCEEGDADYSISVVSQIGKSLVLDVQSSPALQSYLVPVAIRSENGEVRTVANLPLKHGLLKWRSPSFGDIVTLLPFNQSHSSVSAVGCGQEYVYITSILPDQPKVKLLGSNSTHVQVSASCGTHSESSDTIAQVHMVEMNDWQSISHLQQPVTLQHPRNSTMEGTYTLQFRCQSTELFPSVVVNRQVVIMSAALLDSLFVNITSASGPSLASGSTIATIGLQGNATWLPQGHCSLHLSLLASNSSGHLVSTQLTALNFDPSIESHLSAVGGGHQNVKVINSQLVSPYTSKPDHALWVAWPIAFDSHLARMLQSQADPKLAISYELCEAQAQGRKCQSSARACEEGSAYYSQPKSCLIFSLDAKTVSAASEESVSPPYHVQLEESGNLTIIDSSSVDISASLHTGFGIPQQLKLPISHSIRFSQQADKSSSVFSLRTQSSARGGILSTLAAQTVAHSSLSNWSDIDVDVRLLPGGNNTYFSLQVVPSMPPVVGYIVFNATINNQSKVATSIFRSPVSEALTLTSLQILHGIYEESGEFSRVHLDIGLGAAPDGPFNHIRSLEFTFGQTSFQASEDWARVQVHHLPGNCLSAVVHVATDSPAALSVHVSAWVRGGNVVHLTPSFTLGKGRSLFTTCGLSTEIQRTISEGKVDSAVFVQSVAVFSDNRTSMSRINAVDLSPGAALINCLPPVQLTAYHNKMQIETQPSVACARSVTPMSDATLLHSVVKLPDGSMVTHSFHPFDFSDEQLYSGSGQFLLSSGQVDVDANDSFSGCLTDHLLSAELFWNVSGMLVDAKLGTLHFSSVESLQPHAIVSLPILPQFSIEKMEISGNGQATTATVWWTASKANLPSYLDGACKTGANGNSEGYKDAWQVHSTILEFVAFDGTLKSVAVGEHDHSISIPLLDGPVIGNITLKQTIYARGWSKSVTLPALQVELPNSVSWPCVNGSEPMFDKLRKCWQRVCKFSNQSTAIAINELMDIGNNIVMCGDSQQPFEQVQISSQTVGKSSSVAVNKCPMGSGWCLYVYTKKSDVAHVCLRRAGELASFAVACIGLTVTPPTVELIFQQPHGSAMAVAGCIYNASFSFEMSERFHSAISNGGVAIQLNVAADVLALQMPTDGKPLARVEAEVSNMKMMGVSNGKVIVQSLVPLIIPSRNTMGGRLKVCATASLFDSLNQTVPLSLLELPAIVKKSICSQTTVAPCTMCIRNQTETLSSLSSYLRVHWTDLMSLNPSIMDPDQPAPVDSAGHLSPLVIGRLRNFDAKTLTQTAMPSLAAKAGLQVSDLVRHNPALWSACDTHQTEANGSAINAACGPQVTDASLGTEVCFPASTLLKELEEI